MRTLRAALRDEEVGEFGRVYTEEAAGRSHLFPDCLATRPVSEGYGEEDLARDLPGLAPEIAAQANVRVVDLDAAEGGEVPGARTDEEFARAAADHGWGSTVMTASGQPPVAANAPAIRARMDLTKFWCFRESNEWSDSDEFYWAACAAADEGTRRTSVTREFEDVDKGETHYFDANTTVFDGLVRNALIVHIECWEKDQGSQETVRRMLDQMTTELRTTAEKLALMPLGDWESSPHYSAMGGMLADLAYALINASADDWVAGHVFTYDRAALQRLSATEFKAAAFDDPTRQEGANDLYTRIDVSEKIALLTRTGSTWSAPAQHWPTARIADAPALAMVGTTLYCAIRSLDNRLYLSRRDTAGQWSPFERIGELLTRHSPALAAHMGKLYLAYTGMGNELEVLFSANGADWSAQVQPPGRAETGPTLGSRDNVLHCAYSAAGTVYYNYSQNSAATSWTQSYSVPGTSTVLTPAFATTPGLLHLAYRHAADGWIYSTVNTSSGWGATTRTDMRTPSAPALAASGDTLYCTVRGDDNKLWVSSASIEAGRPNPNLGWNGLAVADGPSRTYSAPALAMLPGNQPCFVYRAAEL